MDDTFSGGDDVSQIGAIGKICVVVVDLLHLRRQCRYVKFEKSYRRNDSSLMLWASMRPRSIRKLIAMRHGVKQKQKTAKLLRYDLSKYAVTSPQNCMPKILNTPKYSVSI